MKTLTVFTPTYNRAHTLKRTYESLCAQSSKDFEWLVVDDGSTDATKECVKEWQAENRIPIHYIYKENGGLHTGYNAAYAAISTELNVCVDSDDFMPEDAVEKIVKAWSERGGKQYAGLIGLDYDARTGEPIGGRFPEDLEECYFPELYIRRIHRGDTKQVMRTDLMRQVAPQQGFSGEKNFNPVYMLLQVCDRYPLLVLNENLCNVDYQQDDSMSRHIYNQYLNSPRSFAKMRRLEMQLKHNTSWNKLRCTVHYVSSCVIARDAHWLKNSPLKALTLAAAPLGVLLAEYIKWKAR